MAKELERGIPCSASSPTVGIKQAPNLPPIPSRITGTGMKNFQVGSQQNLAKGVSSQVNCPDMEIFREDRSFITDDKAQVSPIHGDAEWLNQDGEELPCGATPQVEPVRQLVSSTAKQAPMLSSTSKKPPFHPKLPNQNPKKPH